MIRQIENTEEKRQNYASAIYHAHNAKDLPVTSISKPMKVTLIIAAFLLIIATLSVVILPSVISLGHELRQPLALLGAGVSPLAEQTVISYGERDVFGEPQTKRIRTETLSGEPVVIQMELQDSGNWVVTEKWLVNSG